MTSHQPHGGPLCPGCHLISEINPPQHYFPTVPFHDPAGRLLRPDVAPRPRAELAPGWNH